MLSYKLIPYLILLACRIMYLAYMLLTVLVQSALANKQIKIWLLNKLFFLFRYGFVSFLDNVDVQKIVEVSSLSEEVNI